MDSVQELTDETFLTCGSFSPVEFDLFDQNWIAPSIDETNIGDDVNVEALARFGDTHFDASFRSG